MNGPLETVGTLDLKINPTRFVRHHPVESDLPEGIRRQPLARTPLRESSLSRKEGSRDNWLPQIGRLFSYCQPPRWRAHLHRYLSGIETVFGDEVGRAGGLLNVPWSRAESHFNVKVVETYWEWTSEDPLKVVRDLEPLFRSFTSRRRFRRIYDSAISNEDEDDLVILSAETATGEKIKFYAKTNRRIRIEVEHQLSGENAFKFPRVRTPTGTTRQGGHTFSSKSGVLNYLERLRERAAEIVNAALLHFGEEARIPTEHISAYYLIASITSAVPDFQTALLLISALVNQGNISASAFQDETDVALEALRLRGIIRRARRGDTYVVAPRFRHALRQLREQANWSLLIPRSAA
jgi:hypothetical protein